MASNDRLRRREAQEGPEQQTAMSPAPPAPDPHVSSVLALQRSAGNRALQRLIYGQKTKQLTVPESYGNQRVRWNGEIIVKAGSPEVPIKDLYSNDTFKEHLRSGLNLGDDPLEKITSRTEQEIKDGVKTLVEPAKAAEGADAPTDEAKAAVDKVVTALQEAAADRNRLLYRGKTAGLYKSLAEAEIRWVIGNPQDYIPGEPDLGKKGRPLTDWVGEGPETNTFYKLACVLIALLKYDVGHTKTRTLIGEPPKNFKDIMQKLHDYYAGQGVQYDDTSTRFAMMNDWGYSLVFAGDSKWEDLAKHAAFKSGEKYIFDIVGHTVKVRAKKDIAKDEKREIKIPKNFFEPDSDEDNYVPGAEFKKNVKYIWVKK
jgi:hypothetical protein